ncbi:ATP-binding protein [Mycobacterium sp. ACS1612]|uniref:ATP-binding protein n=1 Tax=Mycobacterium sp. ACS1612 TaxID=1834117 RepID=UPI000AA4BDEE|nr:ATP-binding protein [Mycobacterium sp. ACS1612]
MSGKEERSSSLASVLAGEPHDVRRALEVLGRILTDNVSTRTTFDGFLHSSLGRFDSDVICEARSLSSVGHITAGLALAALIDKFDPPIGPGDDHEPPTWASVEIGEKKVAPPATLAVFFDAGQLAPVPVVVRIVSNDFGEYRRIQVYAAPADREHATRVLDAIMEDASGRMSLFRGRALTASVEQGLVLEPVDLPDISRASVVLPEEVWAEIDLNVAAVTVHRDLMERLGLGVRRGILLAGPPGVGKSLVSRVLARELLGQFTVVMVDARAGHSALSDIYREARNFGPTLVIIEDIDLIVGNRKSRGVNSVLSEFLAVMDADPMASLLTVASTNDVKTLDAAAVRSARFDSIIEIGYPTREAAARILSTYLHGVPGAEDVELEAVAAHFGRDISGADIREIVRRTVLAASGHVSTTDLITTVKSGRFKPHMPGGNYL